MCILKGEGILNVSSIINKPAYTDNGNKYNRFSGGKKVAAAALPTVMLASSLVKGNLQAGFKEAGELGVRKAHVVGIIALSLATYAGLGTGVGAIVDACVNKSRRSKADKAAQAGTHFMTQG